MEYLINKEDWFIERTDYAATLKAGDGEGECRLPLGSHNWEDTQIWALVDLLNSCYRRGVHVGRQEKMSEIRQALGLRQKMGDK